MATTSEISGVIERAKNAVVQIWNNPHVMNGTGFIYDSRGFILTSKNHVDHQALVTIVLSSGAELRGVVLGRDEVSQLAVIGVKVNSPLDAIGFESSSKLVRSDPNVGDRVVSMGYNLAFMGLGFDAYFMATDGVISAVRERQVTRNMLLVEVEYEHEYANTSMSFEGGPLLDIEGDFVGMNTSASSHLPPDLPDHNKGYAIDYRGSFEFLPFVPLLMHGYCTTATGFTLEPRKKYQLSLRFEEGTHFRYKFFVMDRANSGKDVTCKIVDPQGREIAMHDRVSVDSDDLALAYSGVYTIQFDNSFSRFTQKHVLLCYEIVPPRITSLIGTSSRLEAVVKQYSEMPT